MPNNVGAKVDITFGQPKSSPIDVQPLLVRLLFDPQDIAFIIFEDLIEKSLKKKREF
jgi:hypothetical protein